MSWEVIKNNLVNKANLVYNFLVCLFLSLHVSGDYVPIIRRNNRMYETLGTCYSVWITVKYALHTRQSSTQSDKYQVSHRYSYFSWWWVHSCPKHVENRNKHTKKELCTRLVLFTRLYKDAGQQNIKLLNQLTERSDGLNMDQLVQFVRYCTQYIHL
jgi:hypothetical protein